MSDTFTEISCQLLDSTDKSLKIAYNGDHHWISRSMCKNGFDNFIPNDFIDLMVDDVVIVEKGL